MKINKGNKIKNIILVIISIALSLFLLEIISRRFVPNRLVFDWGVPPQGPSHDSTETSIFKVYSDLNPLHYGLKPGAKSGFCSIDCYGLRGEFKDMKIDKKNILFCGDSIIFGYGLHDLETIPHLLEDRLGKGYRVFNLGVPGYNTEQESLLLKKIANIIPPSMILVGYFINDAEESQIMRINGRARKKYWIEYYPTPIVFNISNEMDLFLYRNSALFRLINMALNKFINKKKLFNRSSDGKMAQLIAIERIKKIAETNRAKLIFFIIPSMEKQWKKYEYYDEHIRIKKY